MFKLDNPFNITYFAVTLALIAVFTAGFIVRLSRPSRKRNKADVLFVVLNGIFIVLALFVAMFMLIQAYGLFGLSLVNNNGALTLLLNSEALFAFTGAGFLLDLTKNLALAGQIIPFALTLLALLCFALLLLKTKRVKKKKQKKQVEPSFVSGNKAEPYGVSASSKEGAFAVTSSHTAEETLGLPASSENPQRNNHRQHQKSSLDNGFELNGAENNNAQHSDAEDIKNKDDIFEGNTTEDENDQGGVPYTGAKHILSEIDRLVTLAGEDLQAKNDGTQTDGRRVHNVREELERAISEGLALKERYSASGNSAKAYENELPITDEGVDEIYNSGEDDRDEELTGEDKEYSVLDSYANAEAENREDEDSVNEEESDLFDKISLESDADFGNAEIEDSDRLANDGEEDMALEPEDGEEITEDDADGWAYALEHETQSESATITGEENNFVEENDEDNDFGLSSDNKHVLSNTRESETVTNTLPNEKTYERANRYFKQQTFEREVEAERLEVRFEGENRLPPIDTTYETATGEIRPVNYSDILLHARARTIIRRPPAKSILEMNGRGNQSAPMAIELNQSELNQPAYEKQNEATNVQNATYVKKAKPINGEKENLQNESAAGKQKPKKDNKKSGKKTEKQTDSGKSDTTATKANSSADAKVVSLNDATNLTVGDETAAVKTTNAAKRGTVNAIRPPVREKVVSPLEAGLPLTKRYIILNRQSAANVFSDYLKQKQAAEKSELKDSLNTIILK